MTCALRVYESLGAVRSITLSAGKVQIYNAADTAFPITNVPDMAPPGSSMPVFDALGVQYLMPFNCSLSLDPLDPIPIIINEGVFSAGDRSQMDELVEIGASCL